MVEYLALDLASTIRHDGRGGVADDLPDAIALTTWIRGKTHRLLPSTSANRLDVDGLHADQQAWTRTIELRQAIRTLLARTVSPRLASRADSGHLLPVPVAVDRVNDACARVLVTPQLDWPPDGEAKRTTHARGSDPVTDIIAAAARSAIDLVTGPHCTELRACTAPRCVRYFIKGHGRQQFCKPSCANRARVARHRRRHTVAEADAH